MAGKSKKSPTAETREHPTHHRPVVAVCRWGAAAAGLALVSVPFLAAAVGSAETAMAIVVGFGLTLVAAALFWILRHCRRCGCARCGKVLPRDRTTPPANFRYHCPDCSVTWVSRIRPGR